MSGESEVATMASPATMKPDASPAQKFRRPRSGYIPTLDGWRAIAVLSVIAYHDRLHRIGHFSDAAIHKYGNLGVDLFFAISGLLICSRLLDEEEVNGRISLKGFYIRRFCRILPPALCFLFCIGLLAVVGIVHSSIGAWLSSLLFVNNYYSVHVHSVDWSLYTNHFWSLAVEEHFYLLLPAILYFFPKGRVKLLTALTFGFLIYAIFVYSQPWLLRDLGGPFAELRTDIKIDGLLFPALLAVLLKRKQFNALCARWINPLTVALVLGGLFLALHRSGLVPVTLVPFGFPLVILSTVLNPKSLLGRFLEFPILRFLGKISYSIYLWQQLFFTGDHVPARWPLGLLQSRPWSIVLVIALATGSFYLIEQPFMRLGHRLAPPATPGRMELASAPSELASEQLPATSCPSLES